jgi:hypothetical protein
MTREVSKYKIFIMLNSNKIIRAIFASKPRTPQPIILTLVPPSLCKVGKSSFPIVNSGGTISVINARDVKRLKALDMIIWNLIFLAVNDEVSSSTNVVLRNEVTIAPTILKHSITLGPSKIPHKCSSY